MENKHINTIYNVFIAVLALITVYMVYMDIKFNNYSKSTLLDEMIYIVFLFDYLFRFAFSENKKIFFKTNIIDLIAIIPFALFLRPLKLFRLIRIARVFRLLSLMAKLFKQLIAIITTNKFHYLLVITLFVSIVSTFFVSYFEELSFFDAFWWSIVTITTVGYGDVVVNTYQAKLVAMLLMLVGIGLIGALTSTLTTYFLRKRKFISPNILTSNMLNTIIDELMRFEELSIEDIKNISDILQKLKQNNIEKNG